MGYEKSGAGPQGPQGDPGPAGATGATGPAGPAGSANISGTTNRVIKFTDPTTGGDSAISDDGSTCTITEPLTVRVDGGLAAAADGLSVRNTTPATSGQARWSPTIILEAHAFVSGADATFLIRITLKPKTSGAYDFTIERSTNGGSSWTTPVTITSSTPSQFVGAVMAASGFATDGSTLCFFDADNSGLFRGGSGDFRVIARSATLPMLLRSPTTTSGQAAFQFYANGGTRGAAEALLEAGDVAAGIVTRWKVMGDGVTEGPRYHLDATVRAAGTFTAAVYTMHRVDLSGAAVTATLPEATDANAGVPLMIVQTVAGTGDLILSPSAGNVEGGASLTIAGLAAAPLRTVELISAGASFGWKVARTT